MRRILAWIAAAAGIAGWLRARARRRSGSQTPVELGPDPRAEELRRRLEETKPLASESDEAVAAETPVDEAADPAPDPVPAPDERRADVHARARAAIDEMRRSATDERADAGREPAGDA